MKGGGYYDCRMFIIYIVAVKLVYQLKENTMQDISTKNISTLDLINAKNATSFKEVGAEDIVPIHGAAIATDPEDGKQYGYIWSEYGDCYAGNSSTIMDQIAMLISLLDSGSKLDMSVVKRMSKGGKEFLSLKLTERE